MATVFKLPTASVASTEVRRRFARQEVQRERASGILSPDEVAGSYDAGRLLSTTLGGQLRALTHDDLAQFKRSAEALGKKFTGGISAKQVIDQSLPVDRERANREIRVSVPVQRLGNDIHFVTNAGPNSDVTRHHVHVQFLNYEASIASPSAPAELVRLLTGGKLRLQCDCGRWNFWYSYLATIGRFNAGRPQTGYPKIRNPQLVGIACKHVLRVMQSLQTPMVKGYVEKMIADGRKSVKPKLVATSKKDAQEMAAQQARQAAWKRTTVESSAERQLRLAQQRRVREIAEKSKLKMPKNAAQLAQAKRKLEMDAHRLASMGGISQKQLEAIIAKLKGG